MSTNAPRNAVVATQDGWLTIPEAARMLGIARHTLLSRALDGELTTQVVAGRRFVSRESVDRLLKQSTA